MGSASQQAIKTQKTKILFLLEAFDKGGIEKVTLDIVNHLDPERYDITIQTFWYGGYCQSQVNDYIKVKPFFFKRYVRGIIRLIAILPPWLLHFLFIHGQYDVEIAASDGGAAKVISGGRNTKTRRICWVHMDVINRGSNLKEFSSAQRAKRIYGKFDIIAPVSEECKKVFVKKYGDDYNYRVIRNPLPVEDIIRKSKEYTPPLSPGIVNIVCVGRIVEQKGFDRLVEACSKITIGKKYHVFIIGSGTKERELENTIKKCGLSNKVTLLGFLENPYPWMKAADVFLLSSRDESFSLVVGESLLLGTPVIATDCCGINEWIDDGKNGILLENSTEGIYSGIVRVLNDPQILEKYRDNLSNFCEKVSFEKRIEEFETLLRG